MTVRIPLREALFTEEPRTLLQTDSSVATAFRYRSGVAALRLVTPAAELVWLPFKGQQIWRYGVAGEDLTMRTHFDEPTASTVFGETYGGFLLHCGLTGIGHPSDEDRHLLHGELPNATYDEAEILVDGDSMVLTGSCRLRRTHSMDVVFRPSVIVDAHDPLLKVTAEIENLRSAPFEYAYMCHINYALFDGSVLEQTASLSGDDFTVVPDEAQDEATAAYTRAIIADPESSNRLDAGQPVRPEYCAIIRPQPAADGWARFFQVRPDGTAAYVGFETEGLPLAVRWISNTGDEASAGFCLPATAHHLGRARADRDGLMRHVPAGGRVTMRVETGLLDAERGAVLRRR